MKKILRRFFTLSIMISLFSTISFAQYIPKYEEFIDFEFNHSKDFFELEFTSNLDTSFDNINTKKIYITDEDFDKEKYNDYIFIEDIYKREVDIRAKDFPFEENKIYYICVQKDLLMEDGNTLGVNIKKPFRLDNKFNKEIEINNSKLEDKIREKLNIYDKKLTLLDLSMIQSLNFDGDFDYNFFKEMNLLKNLKTIKIKNYDFTYDNDFELKYYDLELVNCKIDKFNIFKNINGLTLDNCQINDFYSIRNLESLMDLKFSNMDLSKYDLDSVFETINKISELELVNCELKNTKFLSKLEHLMKLYISSDVLVDTYDLPDSIYLQDIDFEYVKVINLKELANKENLVCFSMSNVDMDESKLKELCKDKKTFDYLELSNCNLKNLDFINDLESLDILNISNNKIENIDSLIKLERLRVLDISDNEIKNIDVFDNLENLTYLTISTNQNEQFKSKIQNLKDIKITVK
ncbi:leucine-rich repeat domain-containing protein [Peptostreptococcaceae bacterium AGR-M142]